MRKEENQLLVEGLPQGKESEIVKESQNHRLVWTLLSAASLAHGSLIQITACFLGPFLHTCLQCRFSCFLIPGNHDRGSQVTARSTGCTEVFHRWVLPMRATLSLTWLLCWACWEAQAGLEPSLKDQFSSSLVYPGKQPPLHEINLACKQG